MALFELWLLFRNLLVTETRCYFFIYYSHPLLSRIDLSDTHISDCRQIRLSYANFIFKNTNITNPYQNASKKQFDTVLSGPQDKTKSGSARQELINQTLFH